MPRYAFLAEDLMEARVVFEVAVDAVLFEPESESESASDEAASQKVFKMVKTPPLHEHGSCSEVQKKGDGSVEKDHSDIRIASRLLET